ncbi:MAG TPA: glycosyltransferase [Verrucomicrobiae bacterium]|nr:glycosyltransferase [Verrucomicrobiae bacterium]
MAYGIEQRRLAFLFNYGWKKVNSHKLLWDLFPHFLLFPTRRALRRAGLMHPEVFFAGSLETASLYKLLRPQCLVYNAHDAFCLYPSAPQSTRSIEREVVRRATLTVTTAETTRLLLIEQYGVSPDRVLNLGHGVDNHRYEALSEPSALSAIPRPRVVSLGTLDMQDVEVTAQCAAQLQGVNFVFIGPGGQRLRDRIRAAGLKNAHFLGPIEQEQLPGYLAHCDVGLICYEAGQRERRLYGSNPMKRYDYSAAGLQIVSVDLLEYQKNPSPMYIADSPDTYVNSIRRALREPRFSRDEIKKFALMNDWSAKYNALISRLNELHPGFHRAVPSLPAGN